MGMAARDDDCAPACDVALSRSRVVPDCRRFFRIRQAFGFLRLRKVRNTRWAGPRCWAWAPAHASSPRPPCSASSARAARATDESSDSRKSAPPTAIHNPAKNVMARYSGRSGATGFTGWRAESTTEMFEL